MTDSSHSDGLIKLLLRRNIIDPDHKLTFAGHVMLTSGLLFFTGIIYTGMLCMSTVWAREWLHKELETPPQVQQSELFNKQTLNPEDRQQIRLVDRLNAIFFISKEGWKATNNALINVGITSFGVTLFALNTTQIFQQAENLKTSQNLYSGYVELRHDLLSAVASKELIKPDKTIVKLDTKNGEYTQLIQDVDARMKVLNLVRLGFDPTPISDLRTRLDSTIGTGSASKPATDLLKPSAPTPSRGSSGS
jgi:hypothetical protein